MRPTVDEYSAGLRCLLDRLRDMRRDRDEWREQHENLLAMYQAQRAELAALRAHEPREELPTAELYNRVGQLLAGWKQGCTPGEWSDFDESVLQAWQSWRVMQMRRHQNDLPAACGERFGKGAHHECSREPNHSGKCRCSCGAENRSVTTTEKNDGT